MRWRRRSEVWFPLLYPSSSPAIFTLPHLSARMSSLHRFTPSSRESQTRCSHKPLSPLKESRHRSTTTPPSFARSVSCCYSLVRCVFPSPPPPCTVWGLGYEHRDLVSPPESWTKTRRNISRLCHIDSSLTHVLISCRLPPPPPPLPALFVLFTRVSGWDYSSHIWNEIDTHICRHEHPRYTYVKYIHSQAHIELQYPYLLWRLSSQFVYRWRKNTDSSTVHLF